MILDKGELLTELSLGINEVNPLRTLGLVALLVERVSTVDEIEILLKRSNELVQDNNLSELQTTELFYYMGNSWSALSSIKFPHPSLELERPECEKAILLFRKAILSSGFCYAHPLLKSAIQINLANHLSEMGRSLEAIRLYDSALQDYPNHGMAIGGKAICVEAFAGRLHENKKRSAMQQLAYDYFRQALSSSNLTPEAEEDFRKRLTNLELNGERLVYSFECGTDPKEVEYKAWCFNNGLYLNPFCDLKHPLGARDYFLLPQVSRKSSDTSRAEIISFFKYYNILKQEYVSTRYILFSGVHLLNVHFSDNHVSLSDTEDEPIHSLSLEKMKLAFRSAYSLLDKVAYFLNEYFQLDTPKNHIYFRSVWYEAKGKKNEKARLREQFINSNNWPLRGLYWLSKDLFYKIEDDLGVSEPVDPEAFKLYTLRNTLEHKFFDISSKNGEIGFSNSIKDFEEKTLKVLRLAREALIYLPQIIETDQRSSLKKSKVLMYNLNLRQLERD